MANHFCTSSARGCSALFWPSGVTNSSWSAAFEPYSLLEQEFVTASWTTMFIVKIVLWVVLWVNFEGFLFFCFQLLVEILMRPTISIRGQKLKSKYVRCRSSSQYARNIFQSTLELALSIPNKTTHDINCIFTRNEDTFKVPLKKKPWKPLI